VSNIQEQYRLLLGTLLHNSIEKEDRTGTGTLSVFGRQIRHQMKDGFPLITTKKMAVKTMMTELRWFLKGDTNIRYLVENGCNIWNGDAYKKYCKTLEEHYNGGGDIATQAEFVRMIKEDREFADHWGELGPIYGKQWRGWFAYNKQVDPVFVDQIRELIKQIKLNPNSRRLMVSAWNVGDLGEMTLPPCHYGFQCYVSGGKLSLMWNQRSVDTFLGLPFNIASYATLLLLLCEETGYEAGELIANLGDVHLYKNHIEQATEQISREAYPLPQIKLSNVNLLEGEWDYELIDYKYHPSIKAPLSN
jgi:thymidylate synthase